MLIIVIIFCMAVAAYFYADSRSKVVWIAKQDELLGVLRAELREWQNKALLRHGSSILGAENSVRPKASGSDDVTVPKVVMRSQMAARAAQKEDPMPQTTVFADGVAYPRVKRETIERAAEIIDATKT